MINTQKIYPYSENRFIFYGGYLFSKNGKNALLGSKGSLILLEDEMVKSIQNKKIPNGLKLKLIQHGLAYINGKISGICEKQIQPQYFIIDLTKKCNFDCIYCFRNLNDSRTISDQTLNDILVYIADYCHKTKQTKISMSKRTALLF